jgi:hypothetical protein
MRRRSRQHDALIGSIPSPLDLEFDLFAVFAALVLNVVAGASWNEDALACDLDVEPFAFLECVGKPPQLLDEFADRVSFLDIAFACHSALLFPGGCSARGLSRDALHCRRRGSIALFGLVSAAISGGGGVCGARAIVIVMAVHAMGNAGHETIHLSFVLRGIFQCDLMPPASTASQVALAIEDPVAAKVGYCDKTGRAALVGNTRTGIHHYGGMFAPGRGRIAEGDPCRPVRRYEAHRGTGRRRRFLDPAWRHQRWALLCSGKTCGTEQ